MLLLVLARKPGVHVFDSIHEHFKWRLWLSAVIGCAVILLFSAYTTYVETRYLLAGRTASAAITDVSEMKGAGRNAEPFIRVKYTFTDVDGSSRKESDDMARSWSVPPTPAINVQYVSGKAGWSRIAGHDRLWMTAPFLICSTVVIVFLVRFYREFQEHERRKASL